MCPSLSFQSRSIQDLLVFWQYGQYLFQGNTTITEGGNREELPRYANLTEVAVAGLKAYAADVRAGTFPDDDHSYGVDEREYENFLGMVEKRRHA